MAMSAKEAAAWRKSHSAKVAKKGASTARRSTAQMDRYKKAVRDRTAAERKHKKATTANRAAKRKVNAIPSTEGGGRWMKKAVGKAYGSTTASHKKTSARKTKTSSNLRKARRNVQRSLRGF